MKNQVLSVDECRALYFDDHSLLEPTRKMFRINGYRNGRYYYSYNEDNSISYFISVTNLIQSTMPTSDGLIKWIADMGYEQSREYANMRADYGTYMHAKFTELLINQKIDLDRLEQDLETYLVSSFLPVSLVGEWIDDIRRDIIGFASFLQEYKVIPLAIEVVLASRDGYAGAVDLICLMEIEEKGFYGEVYKSGVNKGKPKETKQKVTVVAIIDFKSGRKYFYEQHEIQLEAYRNMVIENFPQFDTEEGIRIYNYSPSDWRTTPGFKLKDQTASPNREKFQHLVKIAAIEMSKREKTFIHINGVLNLGRDLKEVYQEINIDNLVMMLERSRRSGEQAPEITPEEQPATITEGGAEPKEMRTKKSKSKPKPKKDDDNIRKNPTPRKRQPRKQASNNRKGKGGNKDGEGLPAES